MSDVFSDVSDFARSPCGAHSGSFQSPPPSMPTALDIDTSTARRTGGAQ